MKKIIYSLPLLLALGACSSEEGLTPEVPSTGGEGNYYLTMNLAVPTDLVSPTRAIDENTQLPGSPNEEAITKLDLYLLDADSESGHTKDAILWSKTGITTGITGDNSNDNYDKNYNVKIELDSSDLQGMADVAGHNISIFIVCNPDQYADNDIATNGLEAKFKPTILTYGNNGQIMPMTNSAYSYIIEDFKGVSGETGVRSKFTAEGNDLIFNLTPTVNTEKKSIDVERALARLDFAANTTGETGWNYPLYDGNVDNGSALTLQLYSITPFNVNTTSYVVRHGATNGTNAANNDVKVFGDGTDGWVADPTWKYGTNAWTKDFVTNVPTYPLVTTKPYTLASFAGETKMSEWNASPANTNYKEWCYISENTIPSNDLMNKEGDDATLPVNATGVIFRFKVLGTDNNPIVPSQTTNLPSNVQVNGNKMIITLPKDGTTEEFTAVDGAFYVEYCGFINHNATENPMEYSVVRNTVYQMKVNKIEHLPNPDDVTYYLTLDINVLYWNKKTVGFDF